MLRERAPEKGADFTGNKRTGSGAKGCFAAIGKRS